MELMRRQLHSLSSRYAGALEDASTGLRVNRPSDDPSGAAEISRLRSSIAHTDTLSRSADAVSTDGELAEGALAEASSVMTEARSLAVQGASSHLTGEARLALAERVSGLRQHLIGVANTQGPNGYLFGGTDTTQPPFGNDGTFVGNSTAKLVELSPGRTTQANVDGAKAFTSTGGVDVFNLLSDLETNLRNGDAAGVAGTLPDLERAGEQVRNARSDAGAMITRAQIAKSSLDATRMALIERQSEVRDADATFALSQLTAARSALEQALAVAQRTVLRERSF